MRISDWSSDVCSSDLQAFAAGRSGWDFAACRTEDYPPEWLGHVPHSHRSIDDARGYANLLRTLLQMKAPAAAGPRDKRAVMPSRSEERTSELQALMRNSYAVFCLQQNIANP